VYFLPIFAKRFNMKRMIGFACVLISLSMHAQNTVQADRLELQQLLTERKQRFDSFAVSLEKRSGIFGNKTKGDIKASNEVLMEIVKTDNRIIRTLNRVVDFRNFEKVTMNYDLRDRNATLKGLETAVDTLSKQNEALTVRNAKLENRMNRKNILLFLLACTSVTLFVRLRRKKKQELQ
jgi:hypothetical protein